MGHLLHEWYIILEVGDAHYISRSKFSFRSSHNDEFTDLSCETNILAGESDASITLGVQFYLKTSSMRSRVSCTQLTLVGTWVMPMSHSMFSFTLKPAG